jgi:hypothetical protein
MILKWMLLYNEREIENSLNSGEKRQKCSWSGWCGIGSVNVQFHIYILNSVTAVRR